MTKPEDIPQAIWDKAFEALHPLVRDQYDKSPFAMVQHLGLAKAILSAVEEERKQCAQMASDKAAEYRNVGEEDADFCGPIAVRLEALASAIRNRKES